MKKSLLAITILLSGLAFSSDVQEINEEIQQRNRKIKKENRERRRENRRESVRVVGEFFDEALGNPSHLKYKPFTKRKLTNIEKSYRPLFRCLVKVGQRKHGGEYGLDVLGGIIDSVTTIEGNLVQDHFLLSQSIEDCRTLRKSFRSDRVDREKYFNLIKVSNFKHSTKRFLLAIYHNFAVSCSATSLKAQVGILFEVAVGLTGGKCLFSNGQVRRYLGPSAGLGGFAMSLRVLFDRYLDEQLDVIAVLNSHLESKETEMVPGKDSPVDGLIVGEGAAGLSSLGPFGVLLDEVEDYPSKEAFIGSYNYSDYSDRDKTANLTLGAGVSFFSLYGSALVEAVPRGMNWGHLFDLLKNEQDD